jgi:hypothetical protein
VCLPNVHLDSCIHAVQVLQSANTVTVDKVLLANGSAGHIVDFVTMVRFHTCSYDPFKHTQRTSDQHAGVSRTKAYKGYSSRPLAAQAEALQRLQQRDAELSMQLDAYRQVQIVTAHVPTQPQDHIHKAYCIAFPL